MPITLAQHFKVDAVVAQGLPYEEVFGSVKSPEVRRYLRTAGTELGRDVRGEDIWVRHCDVLMRYYSSFGMKRFAFTDVRFPNEASYIQDHMDGRVVRLTGGNDDLPEGHRSESYYDSLRYDATIPNEAHNHPFSPQRACRKIVEWFPALEHEYLCWF